jgi:TolB-like protein
VDLRAARRQLESGPARTAIEKLARRRWEWIAAGAAIAALIFVAFFVFSPSPPPEETAPADSKPSIAVLYFDNASGDPELDWLRIGLTEMLVTDLSQSLSMEILSPDRLYQILKDMGRLDDQITSNEVVQEVGGKTNATTIVLGSFMKAGETIRINIRVQDASTGTIRSTEKIQGVGDSSIFSMVDDLTQRIKTSFDIPAQSSEPDMDIREVTTSSVEAYRYFIEGRNLHMRGDHLEAITFYEKAVELDPQFASAFRALAAAHSADPEKREKYARLALEHAERLTIRERYFVEGFYYFFHEEKREVAIQALEKLVELYPHASMERSYLANLYKLSERFDEAIENYEELRRRKYPYAGT